MKAKEKEKSKKRVETTQQDQLSLLDRVSVFIELYEKKLIYSIMAIGLLSSILLFDVKVSLSGDDCDYILAARDFWQNFTYPGHHGSLYPMLLAPFIGIFGIRLIMLKLLSAFLIVASLWFFYKAFQCIVPTIILIPALLLVSINPYVFFFASYTYSEPLYMFLQALLFYLFSKYFWRNKKDYTLKKDWSKYVMISLVIIGMGLTRTIGFCTIGLVILYFVMERRWKDLLYSASIFFLLFGLFYVSKAFIWPDAASIQSFETLLAKNPYNPEQGAEDISGLIKRVTENSHIYLSGYLYKYLGFRSSSDMPLNDIPVLSLLTYLLFFISMAAVFKKNKFLTFAGLYAGAMLLANFVLLHKLWAQDRFIMVYYPLVILFLLGGFYYLLTDERFKNFKFIYPVIMIAIFMGTGIHAKSRIDRNIPVLQQNLLGNELYGFTPDWENFIRMSRWANENFDKDAVIVSRKPSISCVYTGRDFHGIFNVPYASISSIVEAYQNDKDNYVYLVLEKSSNAQVLTGLAPYTQYVFISKANGHFLINGQMIKAADVYKISKEIFSGEVTDFLIKNNINYTLDFNSFLQQYVDDNNVEYQIINPDVLLDYIKSNNIKYLILAKIRLYTAQNTGMFINTIHQYISLIQQKYPEQFTLIHSIGKEEICELAEFIGK